jgi:hypothetical protein
LISRCIPRRIPRFYGQCATHRAPFLFGENDMKKTLASLPLAALLVTLAPSAVAQESKTPFQKVFDVVSAPKILHRSFKAILGDLKGLCKKTTRPEADQVKNGNVDCVPEAGIDSIALIGEADTEIDRVEVQFHGDDKNAYAKSVLLKNFGAHPEFRNSALNWRPKKQKKSDAQSYVALEIDKTATYVTIGNETDTGDGED